MELDDLKATWSQQTMQIDLLLAERNARRIRPAIARLRASISIELVFMGIVVIALGSFTYDHRTQTALAVSGLVLCVYALAFVQGSIRQLIAIGAVRADGSVLTLQRELERVRLIRTVTVSGAILIGTLMWLPALAVFVSAAFGIDLYGVLAPAYLAANVAFGIAVTAVAVLAARCIRSGATLRRAVADILSGSDLRAARDYAASLEGFENG